MAGKADLDPHQERAPGIEALMAKRDRARARLTETERLRAERFLTFELPGASIPAFAAARTAYQRVLYPLIVTGEALSPAEIGYLLIARWTYNTDIPSIRRRLALAVRQGEVRSVGEDRYAATSVAVENLRLAEERWLRATGPRPPAPARPRPGRPGSGHPGRPRSRSLGDRRPPRKFPWRHDAS
ncbi:MAG: hypothetical protein HY682_05780 [Chloroflexi bacterium]|nr:hypothetical protein [Chloroflexota bacterium]